MLSALLILTLAASAGSNADVAAGIAAYDGGDYAQAVAELEEALEGPGRLRSKNVPLANLYLSRSLLMLTAADPDAAGTLRAAQAIIDGRAADRGRLSEELDAQAEAVHMLLLQGVAAALATSERATIAAVEPWADAAVELVPAAYPARYFRGQVRESLGRSEEALADYGAALDIAEASPPEPPDLLVGYVAVDAATLALYAREDADATLALTGRGLALVDRERGRMPAPSAEQHAEISQALQRLELATFIRFPALHDRARAELAALIAGGTEEYVLIVTYAQLMASTEPEVAISTYERAIAVDPEQPAAHYSLGALYTSRGVALLQQANEIDDYDASMKVHESGLDAYRHAQPHLERALSLRPGDRELIRSLMQIALLLDDTESYHDLRRQESMLP